MTNPFNEKEKPQFAGIGLIILRTIISANLMLAALILSYNSYKEYARGPNNIYKFPIELKAAIKATVPLSIWIFSILFFFCNTLLWRNKKDKSIYVWRYFIVFASQGTILNFVFLRSGTAILIVQNLAIIYLALFILIWNGIKGLWAAGSKITFCRFLHINILRTNRYFKERPSSIFLLGFMVLLALCPLLLIFKQENAAEGAANIAYLLLVIGVGIEAYHTGRQNKYEDHDEIK